MRPIRFLFNILIVILGLCHGALAADRPRAEPYQIWLDANQQLHRSGELGKASNLTWVIVENGEIVLSRLAENELSYTYYNNQPDREYFVYLQAWGTSHYVRVSNVVGYRYGSVSDAPIITSERAAVAVRGKPFSYVISATGNDLQYTVSTLPPGLTLDDQGVISGTPTAVGHHVVTLTATSGHRSGTAALALSVVSGVNDGGATDRYTLVLDSSYKVTWNAIPPTETSLAMVVKRGGTTQLSRNVLGETRDGYYLNYSGSVYSIHLESSAVRVSNIVYYSPGTAEGWPIITSASGAVGTVGVPFVGYQITAQNAPTRFSATGLPNGLSISPTGYISGTPAASGTFKIELAALNSVGTSRATLTLGISAAGTPGQIFSLARDASGVTWRSSGEMPGLCWVVTSGGVTRLQRAAAGELSFFYQNAALAAPFTVHLEAWIDGRYRRVSNVVGDGVPLSFEQTSRLVLRAGEAMPPFTITLTGPYDSLSVGALPAGLTRSGAQITGTPTAPGVYSVPISASYAGQSVSSTLQIDVRAASAGTAVESRYVLSLDPGSLVVARSAGTDGDLTWVVTRQGEVVLRRNAVSEASFIHQRSFMAGESTVHLEASVEGVFRRVSNVVGYRTPSNNVAPVFVTSRRLVLPAGRAVSQALLASGAPTSYGAFSGLPAGLSISVSGVLSGVPSSVGRYPAVFSATNASGTGYGDFIVEVVPAPTDSSYASRHRLALTEDNAVARSPGGDKNLSWVVRRDGEERYNVVAGEELFYRYHRNFEPGAYTIHLEAYLDGAYRVVSNAVSYTVAPGGGDALLAHALGGVQGNSATYLEPSVSIGAFPDGRPAFVLRYTVNRADKAVRATLEGCVNLGEWAAVDPLRRVGGGDETFELREDLMPIGPGSPRFFRVKLERVSP